MKKFSLLNPMKRRMILFAVLFSFFVLQGCTTPLIDVDLAMGPGSCGGAGGGGVDGATGCSPLNATGQSASGFVGVGGPSPVGNQTCQSGTYSGGGYCGWGKSCKSVYYYSNSQCAHACL